MKILHALWLPVLILVPSGPATIDGEKILALLNMASPSHFIFSKVLVRALAARGHEVTVLSPDAGKETSIPNLKYVHLDGVYDNIRKNFDYESYTHESALSQIYTIMDWTAYTCEKSFQSQGIKEILNPSSTETFDLIITEAAWGECFLGFIPKFGYPPIVAISAFGIVSTAGIAMGTSFNPAYMPNMFLDYSTENTAFQRLKNFVIHNLYVYLYYNKVLPDHQQIASKYIKQEMPSFAEIQSNFSIFLANSVFGLDVAIPLSPNIIPVGGMHIKNKSDPLPGDLEKFLDEAKEGFIFFSLGSNLHSDALPKQKRQDILDAFSELRQRVLWKFESDNLEGLPPNVKIGKWLPQSDILAHPNIRMFISHCGKMSSVESTYRGVPIVGIPFFLDQRSNLNILISKGVAVRVDYATLTKQSLLEGVQQILNNSSYQANMNKLSAIYREHPLPALDRAIFWTEYVIKHGGAPHLRPASTALYWYQFLLLDVILILASGILVLFVLIYYILKKVYNMLTTKSPDKKKTN